jgi:hypothetical protein
MTEMPDESATNEQIVLPALVGGDILNSEPAVHGLARFASLAREMTQHRAKN